MLFPPPVSTTIHIKDLSFSQQKKAHFHQLWHLAADSYLHAVEI